MNLEPPDLRIPLRPRSHLFSVLAAGALLATIAAYLWDPALAVAFASAVAIFIPAALLGRLVPMRRGRDFGSGSIGSVLLVAVIIGYLLAAMRWALPWLLSYLA